LSGRTPTERGDLKTFAEFNRHVRMWAEAGLKAGKTPEQLADEGWKVPEKYSGYPKEVANPRTPPANPPLFGGLAGRIKKLQAEMGKEKRVGDWGGGGGGATDPRPPGPPHPP